MRIEKLVKTDRRGFTLVELLVVIAIIGVLVALLLPAIQAARESARRSQCLSQIRQVIYASQLYVDTEGHFPPAIDEWGFSHLAHILPFHEQAALHNLVDFDEKWNTRANAVAYETPVPFFKCPSNPPVELVQTSPTGSNAATDSPLRGHYGAVLGAKTACPAPTGDPYTLARGSDCTGGGPANNGIMYSESQTKYKDITDGASNTLLVGELGGDVGLIRAWMVGSADPPWNAWVYSGKNVHWPINFARREYPFKNSDVSFRSYHPGGAQFGFADGSAKFISENIELELYKALASREAGEVAGE